MAFGSRRLVSSALTQKTVTRSTSGATTTSSQPRRHAPNVAALQALPLAANDVGRAVADVPCPAMVTPAVWNTIPIELRERVKLRGGRLFLQRVRPADVAVQRALQEIVAEDQRHQAA